MNEIKCPHCGQMFQVDASGYDAIVKQVRDEEFQKDIHERLATAEREKNDAIRMAVAEAERKHASEIVTRERQMADIRDKLTQATYQAQMVEQRAQSDMQLAVQKARAETQQQMAAKSQEVIQLQGRLASTQAELQAAQIMAKAEIQSVRATYDEQLRMKEEEVAYYRDFKARQSTKMIGESLEQHCLAEFEKVRALGFAGAYFEKDNDARTGSKGDFIFRDFDENGREYISAMLEMKNEADETEKKHKNSDFFRELDKDRREKGCEYAILVTLLEADSELYNQGIVDVSHVYPKMYVIRPQFLIPMLTLLRNAARGSLEIRHELARTQAMNADFTQLESNINDFKQRFGRNYELAARQMATAIDEIDKTIAHLQKMRDALVSSGRNYRLANDKAQAMSVPSLTKGCSRSFREDAAETAKQAPNAVTPSD